MIKIAIQEGKNQNFFTAYWIEYCKRNSIDYKLIDAYSNDIVSEVRGCNVFLWHFSNYDYRDSLFAKQLLNSVERMGITIFPNHNTAWHFDDKIGQKYLMEAIDAPLAPVWVFYDKQSAEEWILQTTFPKIFKLRAGSGSNNVKLIASKADARKMVNKAFGRGFSFYNRINPIKDAIQNWLRKKGPLSGVFKSIYRLFFTSPNIKYSTREKGYVYFQEFIENDGFDIRIVVADGKAFALKRYVRPNDFRASGSGAIEYDHNQISLECVRIALDVASKLETQILSFDFVLDSKTNEAYIIEISYGIASMAYEDCTGYWDNDLTFHPGHVSFHAWMLEAILKETKEKNG